MGAGPGRGRRPGILGPSRGGHGPANASRSRSVERIGFVGLGTMGLSMARNILSAGAELTVWNRTSGRAGELTGAGAIEVGSPADVGSRSDVVVTCVSDTPDVEGVLFGSDGLALGLASGSLVIDCSTISPTATQEFDRRLAGGGIGLVDAPVSGGSEGARLGTLTIFVGGSDADVARAMPVLAAMGRTITHMGPSGSGQAAKAVNQVILAGTYLGLAEGLVLGLEAGLDPSRLVAALSGGSAQSWALTNRSQNMVEDRYPLGFKLALHRKDLGIALQLAETLGAELPLAAMIAAIEDELLAGGHGSEDMSVLARAVRERRKAP
ncbi:MAG TPA: NAD(P)-dependent oxidoreductase [Candidatus Limnocylindrales bacterium]